MPGIYQFHSSKCYSYRIKAGMPTFAGVIMKLLALSFLFAQLKPNWG